MHYVCKQLGGHTKLMSRNLDYIHIDVDSDSQVWVHNNYARIQPTVQCHVIWMSYNLKKGKQAGLNSFPVSFDMTLGKLHTYSLLYLVFFLIH